MTELSLFHFDAHELRTVTIDGEIEFVAADVARILGHAQAKDMLRSLDGDEKGRRLVPTLGGRQKLSTITEAGLYKAIMLRQTGRMTDARAKAYVKRFQRWVTHEVLPSIRKHGAYIVTDKLREMAADPRVMRDLLDKLIEEKDALEAKIEADATKVTFHDAYHVADRAIEVGHFAKTLHQNGIDIGRNRLFEFFRDNGYVMNTGLDRNLPTQRSRNLELMKIDVRENRDRRTGPDHYFVTILTPKGQAYFLERFLDGTYSLSA